MYKAKLLQLSETFGEEVAIEINGMNIIGFIEGCPYRIIPGNVYPINLSLTILDDPNIIVLSEPKQAIEHIKGKFSYIIYGKVIKNAIETVNNIVIEDDFFSQNSYLEEKYIKLNVDRISIEFLKE